MPISQQGQLNASALIVPDLYVQIVPPTTAFLNGQATNILGIVGTAQWGPVNSPTPVSSMAEYAQKFGALQARKYDMGTQLAAAVLQGANNMRCVRVTDGTDAAATGTLTATSANDAAAIVAAINGGQSGLRGPSQVVVASNSTTTVTLTAKYTGTLGNAIAATIGSGSKAGTTKVTVQLPGQVPEVFDNIGAAAATTGSATMSGGSDGATTITGAVLVGQDTVPRKGMYALRNTGAAVGFLADVDDTTTFAAQVAYGLSEGTYMVGVTPAGDTISGAVTAKNTAAIDAYAFKYLFGDWIYWNDTVNGTVRLISPQGFVAGRLANLSPEQSSLNKPLYGIVGTQKSYQNQAYSNAELQTLASAGIDLVTNPIPAGQQFGVRFGHNSSSNPVINGDTYTRMTNYIATTLNAGLGTFVGKLQTPSLRLDAAATLSSFLDNLARQNMIGNAAGSQPYSVQLDSANNPAGRVALGFMQADVKVQYLSVVEKFLVNMEGGQSVTISRQAVALA
jgi:hypothetical protein